MKIFALSGSNIDNSINWQLLQFVKKRYSNQFDISVDNVKDIPLFKEGEPEPPKIKKLSKDIKNADLVLFATPERQHSVPSALKSALEWLSSAEHPFQNKPVAIISTSIMPQGGVRAQNRLRVIITAGGFQCHIFDAAEFMVERDAKSFDDQGNLKDHFKIKLLDAYMDALAKWMAYFTK